MNSTPHTVIGYATIKLIGGNPLGFLLAFGSHLLADYVGENNSKMSNNKQRFLFDVIPTILLGIFCYFYGGWSEVGLLFLGSFFGNLPDLIDKKMYLTIILPSKFKNTEYLHWQKIAIKLTPNFTKYMGYGLVLIYALIIIL